MSIELFVSHSHKDVHLATSLVTFLVDGVGISKDEVRYTSNIITGLESGDRLLSQLRRDIKDCRFFLPLITDYSNKSQFVATEIGAAWAFKKKTIPLVFNKRNLKLPPQLARLVCRDLSNTLDLIKLAEDLSRAIFRSSDRAKAVDIINAANSFLKSITQ